MRRISISIHLMPLMFFCVTLYAREAEEIDGFPYGPVKEATKTQYSRDNKVTAKYTWLFNEKKHLLEASHIFTDWSLQGKFRWNETGDIEEATFYKDGQFQYKQTQKYDNSDILSTHYITWSESDMVSPFYQYKHKGNILEYARYDEKNHLQSREEYAWDAQGNRIESRCYDSNNTLTYRVVTSYYKPHQILEESSFDREGKRTRHSINKYHLQGKAAESLSESDGNVFRRIYIYDNDGNLLEEIAYRNDRVEGRATYTYMEGNKKSIRTDWDAQGSQTNSEETTRDNRGNIIERITKSPDGKAHRTVAVFDEKNRSIQEETWEGDLLKSSRKTSFDEEGRTLEENFFNASDSSRQNTVESYRYDRYGNMTERIIRIFVNDIKKPETEYKTVWNYEYYGDSEK